MRALSEDRAAYLAPLFWARVDRRGEDECWLWTGCKRPDGYGVIGYRRDGQYRANRVSLALTVGDRPESLALHSCDNPHCVNPAHLRWGSNQDNHDDARSRRRNRLGERNGSSKLTASQVEAIRKDGRICREIARDFGVAPQTIWDIRVGRTWPDSNITGAGK